VTGAAISVAIADDQALIRAGFRMILQEASGFAVVGEAADGEAAVHLATRARPDVILMDIRMPALDGIEATRRIRAAAGTEPAPRILILTTFDLDEYVYSALKAGASGFVLKDTLAHDLLAAIRIVHAGDAVTSPAITRRLIAHYTDGPAPVPAGQVAVSRLAPLTPREREVLTLIASGMSNTEIATTLVLSEGTVKTHVGRIFAKLGLRDRVHAVITGYQAGLVSPASPGPRPETAPGQHTRGTRPAL
jgi:DNA-binding NarL/FixJ family response regulator